MSDRLKDKAFVVTGAARGMGRSHAIQIAEEGADVILIDACADMDTIPYPMSTPDDLAEVVAEVVARDRKAFSAQVDVSDRGALEDAITEGVAALGRLDGSVANAGVINSGTWDEVTDTDWRKVLDVNLIGAWNTCAAVIPHLPETGGSLVNIGSAGALNAQPFNLPYVASKWGINGFSRALANELAAQSIRVNVVHPTGVLTGINAPRMIELVQGERSDVAPLFANKLPVFLVEPVDVSNAVVYLLSDEARYVTGTEIRVDAGITAN
ncbi:mycofactocin-coupled SDR family oxidoreductase [Gordonia rhizosphera]|uniref:Putative oxidoreductase n=1 Tax=Gordonia rhizosphera NBRC 16068 TaxID=1108045 RepID=K6V8V6_9ACTN|nr:mycofactocin-coupled SDR family oxidoreductase [Gordonia rhizosphera]GAB92658.1 putative oxidoreductase [Gordonia rhizosphera NBRC 16068]